MKILVTGGAGYIGSHAVLALLDQDHEVSVIDNLSTGFQKAVDARAKFYELDIQDKDKVREILKADQIDAVMHFAAFIEVGESVKNPNKYLGNNFEKAKKLLEAMEEAEVKRFIFSSTAAVYGEPKTIPILETAETNPINPYGESKLKLENEVQKRVAQKKLSAIIFRYFNVVGADPRGRAGEAHEPESHLIPNILKSAQNAEKVFSIFGTDYDTPDGTCIRDFVHVNDLVEAHLLGLINFSNKLQIFNLGSAQGFSVKEVFSACEKALGQKIKKQEVDRRAGDPPRLISDSQKVRTGLHWSPQYESLEKMIEHQWNWMKKHPRGYSD